MSNIDASSQWYSDVLGFETLNRVDMEERGIRQANLKRGNATIELIEIITAIYPKDILKGKAKRTQIAGYFKIGFSVSDFDKWENFLTESGVDSTRVLEKVRAENGGCAAPPDIAVTVLENYLKHDMTNSLREIKAPIHCINSDFVPTDIEAAQRYVSSFKVEIMSGVGHLLLWEDTAKFNRLLGDVIKTFESS